MVLSNPAAVEMKLHWSIGCDFTTSQSWFNLSGIVRVSCTVLAVQGHVAPCDDVTKGLITGLHGELYLEGLVKSTMLKLMWLSETSELVPVTLVA